MSSANGQTKPSFASLEPNATKSTPRKSASYTRGKNIWRIVYGSRMMMIVLIIRLAEVVE
jgi:hypothetical protein